MDMVAGHDVVQVFEPTRAFVVCTNRQGLAEKLPCSTTQFVDQYTGIARNVG